MARRQRCAGEVPAVNPLIAGKLNRPDLLSSPLANNSGMPIDPYGGSSGIAQAGAGAVGSFPGASLGASFSGRATAGVLIVALLVVGGFYVWTRGVQA